MFTVNDCTKKVVFKIYSLQKYMVTSMTYWLMLLLMGKA